MTFIPLSHRKMHIHLTSCTPTKSNLHLDNSFETVIRDPTLYRMTNITTNIFSVFPYLINIYDFKILYNLNALLLCIYIHWN
jgi:hypothetical protein